MPSTLYICYFGVREPLVQTQVIPYLLEIMKDGIEVSLLTFEPGGFGGEAEETALREDLAGKGVDWHWLRYHKRPSAPATAYDVLAGAWYIRKLIKKKKFDVLHGRVHIPTLMAAIARKFSSHKPKLLFDIRGFFPEEYTDAGIWPEGGWLYHSAKRVEKWLLKESDGFVVLTEKARTILFPESTETGFDKSGRPVEVIPCCVDLRRFESDKSREHGEYISEKLNIYDRIVFAHVGALGGLYLTKEIADFLQSARERDPRVFALFLTQSSPELIIPLLKQRGFKDTDFFVDRVDPLEIPAYLRDSNAGISFVKASFSTLSRSPTKIAEYLACGLPLIANSGVGDVDELVLQNRIGALVYEFSPEGYRAALDRTEELGDSRDRLTETVRREFDLEAVGGRRYRRIYKRLLES